MYNRILIPLDGSALSESVLPSARSLLQALKVPAELLQVLDPELLSIYVNPAHDRSLTRVEKDMRRQALEYLEPLASSLPEPGAVTCSVEVGTPAEVIVKKAGADPTTLIAMATHGRSGFQRWLLGSVAYKVSLLTANPLLLARPDGGSAGVGVAPLRAVVVPLDGSALAERALPHAQALAKKMNLDVVLLRAYALPPVAYYTSEGYVPDVDDLMAEGRENAGRYLDQIRERVQSEGIARVSTLLLEGDAAGNIIEIAKQRPGHLVVLCTHGRSGFSRWVLGSVAGRVIHESGVALLVIPPGPERRSSGD
jgi:nucleotide-binding universal stress UspA family protein